MTRIGHLHHPAGGFWQRGPARAPGPTVHELPGSLQLIGGPDAEALLLATGAIIEAAV